MKKFYAILCLAIASITQLQAQAPQGFNYQATVRNSSGDLIVNTNVYFKFNVIQGSQTAVPIFTETHYVPTDDLGQVNLVIGQGTANTGIFSELDWSLGSYYLGIELNTGNGYVAMGTTQLLSVPYALYAENSGNATPTTPNLETVLAENNSANSQQIKDLQDPTDAQDAVTKNYVDTEVSNNVQNIEQVLTQGNDANGIQLKGIADPTEAQDAVTKAYLENNITSSGLAPGNTVGDMLYWDGENWTQINAPENNGTLKFCDGQLTWGPCKASIEISQTVLKFGDIIGRISIITNGSNIINRGGFYSTTNPNPSSADNILYFNDNYLISLDDDFAIQNPNALTTYYIKVFVESNLGISYSDVIEFTTPSLLTDIDGNTYDYLTYGDQVWTVENAEMVTYRDGTEIPQVTDANEWSNTTTGAWAYYNNDPTKPRLYNWFAVMGIHDNDPNTPNKEFAPEGWHVPSDAEWTTLEEYLIANGYNYDGTTTGNKIAKSMASTTGWFGFTELGAIGNDQSLNNSSGFNAFPEGFRDDYGSFSYEGYNAFFWSSTEYDSYDAWFRNLSSNSSNLYRLYSYKQFGFSVRFVRD